MKKNTLLIVMLMINLALLQCSSQNKTADKKWLVETLDNKKIAVSRGYLDGFRDLSAKERVKLYYLARASIAGRDIFYDQRHKDAIRIRQFFESVVSQNKVESPLKEKITEYLKLIWVNNSQYHTRTGLKIVPGFTFEELQTALPGENIAWLKPTVFDQKTEFVLTNLDPKPTEGDIIQASATNIYAQDLSLKDIEALDNFWQTKLNVSFEKKNNQVVPKVYKSGGLYGEELERVCFFLEKAAALSEGAQKEGLEKLIAYYRSGDEQTFKEASIAWLSSQPLVDTINGFIETYMDPRQMVGSWEGITYYISNDKLLNEFSHNVQYFEDRMPWSDAYKKKNISSKPVATLINVAASIGDAGPVTMSGINLPNYQDIRSKYGSKNVVLSNLIESRQQVVRGDTIKNFYLNEYHDLMDRHYEMAYTLLLYMHEVIGHGSGKSDDKLVGDPRDYIGQNYGTWEEARASLVAYHHVADPKLVEMGAFKKEEHEDVMKAFYLRELQGQLLTLRNAQHEDILREAHDRADQMIFEYIRQNTKGFDVVDVNGNYYVKINDVHEVHKGASQLLAIVHEAKATGNKKTVDEYIKRYGTTFNKSWRDNIVKRANEAGLPELFAMVFPKLVPEFKDNQIVDIKLDDSESFYDQQMRFGRLSETTEVSEKIH